MINVLDTASIGYPITREGISLFPVYLHQDGAMPEIPIVAGSADLIVSEVDGGHVPVLQVTNPGWRPVLLTEGETVVGGRQNRVLNVSVLVPGAATIQIPVSCVEQGRWNQGDRFERANWKATRRVRRTMVHGLQHNLEQGHKAADQGAVWSAIDHELHRFAAHNDTGALHEVRRARIDDDGARAANELVARGPLPQQCGVVVARGSRIVGAEVYASPELLAASWEGIIRPVMLEADGRPSRPSATQALRFLHRLGTGPQRVEPGVGLGREVHVRTNKMVGQALLLDDLLVHASAFALAA